MAVSWSVLALSAEAAIGLRSTSQNSSGIVAAAVAVGILLTSLDTSRAARSREARKILSGRGNGADYERHQSHARRYFSPINEDNVFAAERIWHQTTPLGPDAIAYFCRRGIDIDAVPEYGGLRWHSRCPWGSTTKRCVVGRYITAIGNEPRGVWRRPIDGGKPKALGPTTGCVIRIWPDDAVEGGLVLGEGVETALAAATRIELRGTLRRPLGPLAPPVIWRISRCSPVSRPNAAG